MKLLYSVSVYFSAILAMVFIFSDSPVWIMPIGFAILLGLHHWAKNTSNDVICEVLGITALQKKFKNNDVIMDMTNE